MGAGALWQELPQALRELFESLDEQELRRLLKARVPDDGVWDGWCDEDCNDTAASTIHRAAAAGDLCLLRACLAADASLLHLRDSYGCTPLHHAASRFQPATVEALLAAGADVHAEDGIGRNAAFAMAQADSHLLTAAQLRAADGILRQLVAAGLDVTAPSRGGVDTPLFAAAEAGNLAILRLLIKHGGEARAAEAADHPLLAELVSCVQLGRQAEEALRLLAELLQHGAAVDARCADSGETLLLAAAREAPALPPQHVAPLLQLLLRHGADATAVDKKGRNVMHHLVMGLSSESASRAALAEALRVLLPAAGGAAALAWRDAGHHTPLWCLLRLNHSDQQRIARSAELVAELLTAGADLQERQSLLNDAHTLPEHLACVALDSSEACEPALAVLSVLQRAGWDVNAVGPSGQTVLQVFLGHVWDTDYQFRARDEGQQPFRGGFLAVLDQLLAWGADPNPPGRGAEVAPTEAALVPGGRQSPTSPLSLALHMGAPVVQRLLAAGASVARGDEAGKSYLLVLWSVFVEEVTSHMEIVQCPFGVEHDGAGEAAAGLLRSFAQRAMLLRGAGAPLLTDAERPQLLAGVAAVRESFDHYSWYTSGAAKNIDLTKQVLLGGPEWSPRLHKDAVPTFRAAAKTLLLINRCRGFPVDGGVCAAAPRRSQRLCQRSAASSGGGGNGGAPSGPRGQQQQRVHLEPEILQGILRHAAADVAPWVAILQIARPWYERPRGLLW